MSVISCMTPRIMIILFLAVVIAKPCPTYAANPAPVPQSGQTTSYASGDDADKMAGAVWPTPRFTDNNDGTVTDNLTDLVWVKITDCGNNTPMTWVEALDFANNLYDGWTGSGAGGDCGLTDNSTQGEWRLPNRRELLSLVDDGKAFPALPSSQPFGSGAAIYRSYWSSTNNPKNSSSAWYIEMLDGTMDNDPKLLSSTYYAWPVRNINSLYIQNETIIDTRTYESTKSITAGENVIIPTATTGAVTTLSPADITMKSKKTILKQGFKATSGSKLHIISR